MMSTDDERDTGSKESNEMLQLKKNRKNMGLEKMRKPSIPDRIQVLAEPRNRVFINLYDKFNNVLDPMRASRIKRKLENINKKTLEELEKIFEEQRLRIEEQRKRLRRSHPKKQDIPQRILYEFFHRFSRVAAKKILTKHYQNPTSMPVRKQRLVNCAYLNINHVVTTACQEQGSQIEKNLQIKLACEVADFVENVLCKKSKCPELL